MLHREGKLSPEYVSHAAESAAKLHTKLRLKSMWMMLLEAIPARLTHFWSFRTVLIIACLWHWFTLPPTIKTKKITVAFNAKL